MIPSEISTTTSIKHSSFNPTFHSTFLPTFYPSAQPIKYPKKAPTTKPSMKPSALPSLYSINYPDESTEETILDESINGASDLSMCIGLDIFVCILVMISMVWLKFRTKRANRLQQDMGTISWPKKNEQH